MCSLFSYLTAHASTVFQNKLWITGGKSQYHPLYDLASGNTENDVWYTEDGGLLDDLITSIRFTIYTNPLQFSSSKMGADEVTDGRFLCTEFWCGSNSTKISICPLVVLQPVLSFFTLNLLVTKYFMLFWRFSRYGHTLDSLDLSFYGVEVMLQLGGFAPQPMNDQWVTEDGSNWVYCREAAWAPRAWHKTTTFKKQLWLYGGTPLNNEIWLLESVTRVNRTILPLTRATFSLYEYDLQWKSFETAAWSPRVGFGLLVHIYYNQSIGETAADAKERMIVAGGFGGWPVTSRSLYDGFAARADIWESYDGTTFNLLTDSAYFGPRSWFGFALFPYAAPDGRSDSIELLRDISESANGALPRMWVFGGGNVGSTTRTKQKLDKVDAYADAYWSRDAVTWVVSEKTHNFYDMKKEKKKKKR